MKEPKANKKRNAERGALPVLWLLCLGGLLGSLAAESPALAAKKDAAKAKAEGSAQPAEASKPAGEEAKTPASEEKLLKVTTLDDAFRAVWRNRTVLGNAILREEAKLRELKEDSEAAEKLRRELEPTRNQYAVLSTAMDVVFAVGQRREYEFNPVTSTVYLKIGTVEEAFVQAVRVRDGLGRLVQEQQELKGSEKDTEKLAALEEKISSLTRQYQTVAAALEVVFGVHPERRYEYDPKNATLYLRISAAELDELRARLQERSAAKPEDSSAEQGGKTASKP